MTISQFQDKTLHGMPILLSSVSLIVLLIILHQTYSHLPFPYLIDLNPYSYDPYLTPLKAKDYRNFLRLLASSYLLPL